MLAGYYLSYLSLSMPEARDGETGGQKSRFAYCMSSNFRLAPKLQM